MRYFDAEKAILAEEKAVRPDGCHLGHFVSFSSSSQERNKDLLVGKEVQKQKVRPSKQKLIIFSDSSGEEEEIILTEPQSPSSHGGITNQEKIDVNRMSH